MLVHKQPSQQQKITRALTLESKNETIPNCTITATRVPVTASEGGHGQPPPLKEQNIL